MKSDPIVSYKETVTSHSSEICLAKSSNKLNRIYGQAQPLNEVAEAIESGKISPKDEVKLRAKLLHEQFDWDKDEALKIWSFGPDNCGGNILTEKTSGVQYMQEIKDSMESAW